MTAIAVVIATFGDLAVWGPRADRAAASVDAQTAPPIDVGRVHGHALHETRNWGARSCRGEWLVFLDADDQLDPHYVEAMAAAAEPGALLQPRTLGVYPDGSTDRDAVFIDAAPTILERNHLVVGTAVERDLFFAVGGFLDWPALEDWCLWIRCLQAGATVKQVPDAVYRVGVGTESRNHLPRREMGDTVRRIRAKYAKAPVRG